MTASNKQREIAISQCRSVEKLAEAVERVNGVDVEFAARLKNVKDKMRAARHSICEEDEVTEDVPLPLVREQEPVQDQE